MAGRASCLWGPSLPQRLQEVVTCVSEAVMDAGSSDRCPARPSPLLTPCPTVSPQVPPARAGGWPLWCPHPFSSPQEDLPCGSGELCMGSLSPRRTHTHTHRPSPRSRRPACPSEVPCPLPRTVVLGDLGDTWGPGGDPGRARRFTGWLASLPDVAEVAGLPVRRGVCIPRRWR